MSVAAAARRGEELFVGMVWLATAALLVHFVVTAPSVLPFTDDVSMGPLLIATPGELWEQLFWQHNEHRIPLVKALYRLLVGGLGDVRAGVWSMGLALPLASLALLGALRRRRGALRATDAALPLVLHGLAGTENLLNSFQLAFVLPLVLALAVLALALAWRSAPGAAGLALIWLLLAALVACCSAGLVLAVSLAPWPLWCVREAGRARAPGWRASVAVGLGGAFGFALAVALYLHGLTTLEGFTAAGPAQLAVTALQFLSTCAGLSLRVHFPWTLAIVLPALLFGAWLALRASARAPERTLAVPLALVLGAGLALAVTIGWSRGTNGPEAGLLSRYAHLAALPLCAALAALSLFGVGRAAAAVRWTALLGLAALWPETIEHARYQAGERGRISAAFLADAQRGAGPRELARAHVANFFYGEELFAEYLADFQRAGLLDALRPGEALASDERAQVLARRFAQLAPGVAGAELPEARQFGEQYALLLPDEQPVELSVPAGSRGLPLHLGLWPAGGDASSRALVEGQDGAGAWTLLGSLDLGPGAPRGAPAWHELRLAFGAETPARLRIHFERRGNSPSPRWNLLGRVAFATGG